MGFAYSWRQALLKLAWQFLLQPCIDIIFSQDFVEMCRRSLSERGQPLVRLCIVRPGTGKGCQQVIELLFRTSAGTFDTALWLRCLLSIAFGYSGLRSLIKLRHLL